MIYRTQCESVKVGRQDLAAFNFNSYFLMLGDVSTSYNFHDSKEKARLEFYFDLLEKYRYPMERIEFDVALSSERSKGLADIVVFKDNQRKISYITIDCCKDRISDDLFEAAVKGVIVKAEALGADFAVCITRLRRRVVKLTRANGIVYTKTVCDLPILYGVG